MIFTASFISSSEMTSGGAKRTLKKRKAKKDDQKSQQEIKIKQKKGHKHINVRRLRQNTSAFQQQTELPCCPSFNTLFFIDNHRV